MKLEIVKDIPGRKLRKSFQPIIEEFANSEGNIAKVHFTEKEYKNVDSCYTCLHRAVRQSKHPMKVVLRSGEIFLVKT